MQASSFPSHGASSHFGVGSEVGSEPVPVQPSEPSKLKNFFKNVAEMAIKVGKVAAAVALVALVIIPLVALAVISAPFLIVGFGIKFAAYLLDKASDFLILIGKSVAGLAVNVFQVASRCFLKLVE